MLWLGHLDKSMLWLSYLDRVKQSFASARCGTAPLRIKKRKIWKHECWGMVCRICNTDVIEDEMHFLMSCNTHQQERHKLLMVVEQNIECFSSLSWENKFVILMNEPQLCTVTARACHNMLRNRRAILYK